MPSFQSHTHFLVFIKVERLKTSKSAYAECYTGPSVLTRITNLILATGNLKKNGFFYIFPNLIKIKKFQEQLIILKGDYDGHFFAQGYFGPQSLHRKKIFQFFVPKRSGV